MSDLVTGTHLQAEDLDGQNIMQELHYFAQWTATVDFEPLNSEVEKCKHEDRERRLEPLLSELGYTLDMIKYQILRIVSRSYIEAGAPAYLVPIRMKETAFGTVYDPSTKPVKVAVGQKLYFKDPIIVEAGMDFLLMTAR